MKRKYFLPVVLLFFLILILIIDGKRSAKLSEQTKKVVINGHEFKVDIADNDVLRGQGLSGVEKLGNDEGMLFIYPTVGIYSFWMKDMKIPLDFIWINEDTVVDITENVPKPDSDDLKSLPTYRAKQPVNRVLEVNSGSVETLGIKNGDKVEFNL